MYTPSFRKTNKNVPILSKEKIDADGERFIHDFCPNALKKPQAIDIETFLEVYLGLTIDFQFLSNDGRYLGMMVFNDTNKVIVYKPEENCADYISAKAGTVLIDNTLLEENQEHRFRYTAGHECGHNIYHWLYYYYDRNQLSLFDDEQLAMVQCRSIAMNHTKNTNPRYWTDEERMEWQANAFSSAILMPKSSVVTLSKDFKDRETNPVPLIWTTSDVFNVSGEAATYRLKALHLIPSDTNYQMLKSSIDYYPLFEH